MGGGGGISKNSNIHSFKGSKIIWPPEIWFQEDSRGLSGKGFSEVQKFDFYCICKNTFFEFCPKFSKTAPLATALCPQKSNWGVLYLQSLVYFENGSDQRSRIWGGVRKLSKMVELLGPQNLKIVELLGPKFANKGRIVKTFTVSSAPRPILSFKSLLYILFDHKWQQFSNFSTFSKKSWKMTNFRKNKKF